MHCDESLEHGSPGRRELKPLHAPISCVSDPLDVASCLEPIAELDDRGRTDAELLS